MTLTVKKALATIEPERVYSLTEIVRAGLIPPIKSYPTAYKAVLEDLAKPEDKRTIKANIIGDGRARTIRITGKNLTAYLEAKGQTK